MMTALVSCGGGSSTAQKSNSGSSGGRQVKIMSSISPTYNEVFRQGATLDLGYKTITADVDSVRYFVDGQAQGSPRLTLPTDRVGKISYGIEAFRNGKSHRMNGQINLVAARAPRITKPRVAARYPHQSDAYTQGLLFDDGKLYESTGEYGSSTVRITDLKSGKVEKRVDLEPKFFGEGLALLDGSLYQLTWREGQVFVYDRTTLNKTAAHSLSGEGWGITTDSKNLYVSNGTSRITVYDPQTFKVIRSFDVADDRSSVEYINELEWIDGKIWANIYTSSTVAIIDPESGVVEEFLDLSELERLIGNPAQADVLNGIAYDEKTGRVWVTGKNWDTLFEIQYK